MSNSFGDPIVCDPDTDFAFHPIAEPYPLLEGTARDELREDIRVNGQQETIKLFDNKIFDGRNRFLVCKELGIPFTVQHFYGTEEQARVKSTSLNYHRRHLTTEQKRTVAEKLLKADPERSDRDIAAEVKCSPTTVGTVRKKLESGVQIGHLDADDSPKGSTAKPKTAKKRTGRDGKKYTVKDKPKSGKKTSKKTTAAPAQPSPAAAAPVVPAESSDPWNKQFGGWLFARTSSDYLTVHERERTGWGDPDGKVVVKLFANTVFGGTIVGLADLTGITIHRLQALTTGAVAPTYHEVLILARVLCFPTEPPVGIPPKIEARLVDANRRWLDAERKHYNNLDKMKPA